MKMALIIAQKEIMLQVLSGTLKVQCFILTEMSGCGLLIVVTSSTLLKRKDISKEKSS